MNAGNTPIVETWLGRLDRPVALAAYATADGWQRLFVATQNGMVIPFVIGPPQWQWQALFAIMTPHPGIVGVAAYFHPGDGHHHCFVALDAGDIWECEIASFSGAAPQERWIGKCNGSAVGLAGFSSPDGSQRLFVAGRDGLVHLLEIGATTSWQWAWRNPITTYHKDIVGISAYHDAGDNAQHVAFALSAGDVWETLCPINGAWSENWLAALDGGAKVFAGHSAPNGTQHLFTCGATERVMPLQIGSPHWKWRWDAPVTAHHDGMVGLASYFHLVDHSQHVFVVLDTGDIWESRFPMRAKVATTDWAPHEFPITYWYGPQDLSDSPNHYKRIADANFTLAFPPGDLYMEPTTNLPILAAAARVGLRMIISDGRISTILVSGKLGLDAPSKQTLDEIIADYSGRSAVAGYFLCDEFFDSFRPLLAEVVAYFREHDPGHLCFINLLPIHAGADGPYIQSYINQVNPGLLSFDHYSLRADGTDESTFIENLHVMRDKAVLHGLSFWQIILAVKHDKYREPTAAEKRFEAMQVLALGGKGISWFTYWQPPYPTYSPAIVDSTGVPTHQYPEVQAINADVRTVGQYLLHAQSVHAFETGVVPPGGVPAPASGLVHVQNQVDLTVGVFAIQQPPNASSATDAFVLVASRNYNISVTAIVRFSAQILSKLDKTADTWVSIDPTVNVNVRLAPGDAELFRLKY